MAWTVSRLGLQVAHGLCVGEHTQLISSDTIAPKLDFVQFTLHNTTFLSGELPMVRWQPGLGQEGMWTIQMEGRVLRMSAPTWESIVRGASILGYESFANLLEEAMNQGLVTLVEELTQP